MKKTLHIPKVDAIRAVTRSKMFVVVTDKEAVVAADFRKGFEGIMMVSAIKQVQSKLQTILDKHLGREEKKRATSSRRKPK